MTATTTATITIYTAVVVFRDTLRGPSVKTGTSQTEVVNFAWDARKRPDVESATVHTTVVGL